MIHPLLDSRHIREYVLYGLAASIGFIIPVIIFLMQNTYENFYFLFIGSGLFMLVILYYTFKLSFRPYDKKRALSMAIGGHFATIAGIIFSCVIATICYVLFNAGLFQPASSTNAVENAPATLGSTQPMNLLLLIFSVATIGNFSVGSFISVVTAYASKVNQTRDKAVPLKTDI